jgi:predicted small lipoprotein YifL
MKSIRPVYSALALSALVFALAGCGKSSDLVSPGPTLDTTPPSAPTAVAGSYDPAAERDYLNWDGSTSPDVAGYEVWQYESDPSPAWFRVRATDQAGNLSAFSSAAQTELHAWDGTPGSRDGQDRDGVN